jgi:DUF4097 and DUF4098 domain-containing protein YvlB
MNLKKYFIISSLVALALIVGGIIGLIMSNPGDIFEMSNGLSFNLNPVAEKYERYEESFDVNDDFKVEMDLLLSDVHIEVHDEDKIEIEYYESKYYTMDISFKNDVLRIDQRKEISPTFGMNTSSRTTTIKVPANMVNDIYISSNLGDITIYDLVVDDAEIRTDLGDITMNDINAKELFIHTNLGEVTLENLRVNKKLTAKTDLGEIDIEDVYADTAEVDTDLGSINIVDLYAKEVDLDTSLGSIDYKNISDKDYEIEDLVVKTDLGDADVDVKAKRKDIKGD